MNTVVWIMVMFSYGSNVNTGPEFKTKESCEVAASIITQSANERSNTVLGSYRKPWCVRIEK
jgi:hypothetical protein